MVKNRFNSISLLLVTFSLCLIISCASVYYQDVKDSNSAKVIVEYQDFSKYVGTVLPAIYEINGKHVAMRHGKKEFYLIPGDYIAKVKYLRWGKVTKSSFKFQIPNTGEYTLLLKYNDGKVLSTVAPIKP